ncbi:MAG TPA: radical SAM protein, partial [Verrucomicrobiae bacterium]|nr:radical SAM protein [Verrucomicrobiae bacterium]
VNLSAVSINPLTISPKLFQLMKEAGFCSLVVTPDSASETMLRNLRKGFGVEQIKLAAELARESKIPCTWFFLLGGPGETRETVEETVSFVETHLNSKQFLNILLTGMRLLPGTLLTERAVADKYISADHDLSAPVFYFSPEVDEQWVINRVNQAIARCPTIVHGAEQNGSPFERGLNRALYWLGAVPPYYRFLPTFLSIPPLPALRARNTQVSAGCFRNRE